MRHLAIFLGLLLVVPAASWAVMAGLQAQVDLALAAKGAPASSVLCRDPQVRSSNSVQTLCTGVSAQSN